MNVCIYTCISGDGSREVCVSRSRIPTGWDPENNDQSHCYHCRVYGRDIIRFAYYDSTDDLKMGRRFHFYRKFMIYRLLIYTKVLKTNEKMQTRIS